MGNSQHRGGARESPKHTNRFSSPKENLHPRDTQKKENSFETNKARASKNAEVMEVQKFDVDDDQYDFASSEKLFQRTSKPNDDTSPKNRKDRNTAGSKPEPKEVSSTHEYNRKEGN